MLIIEFYAAIGSRIICYPAYLSSHNTLPHYIKKVVDQVRFSLSRLIAECDTTYRISWYGFKLITINWQQGNNSLKQTVTRGTDFAEKAKLAPRYGGLVPPLVC